MPENEGRALLGFHRDLLLPSQEERRVSSFEIVVQINDKSQQGHVSIVTSFLSQGKLGGR